jgi:hypothetical protein
MFATKLLYASLLVAIVSATSAWAQPVEYYAEPPGGYYQPVPPLPPDYGFAYHHASTAAEGWLRGQAACIYAAGSYWLSVNQALICQEQARMLALANQQRWIDHCIAMRAQYEAERLHRIEERRMANEAHWLSRYQAYLLTPAELNRFTGELNWPEALRAPEYFGLRTRLDELFRQRAGYTDSPVGCEVELQQCVDSLTKSLKRNVGTMPGPEFLAAHKFLCGLKYEHYFAAHIN